MQKRPPEDDRPASSRRNDLEKKGGRGLKKAVMKPEPKENPAQKSSGDRDRTCLEMLMRHPNSLEFYPAIVKKELQLLKHRPADLSTG